MRFLHISDLHLGKRVNEYSMIDDQSYILEQIVELARVHTPEGVLIAGDVYDKTTPSAEAVALFDEFLYKLSQIPTRVFIISGNHDSAERIAFGGRLMQKSGVCLSPVYNGEVLPITLADEYGEVDVYLLPFIKPAHVRRYFENENIESYTDAMRVAISKMPIDTKRRNVLVTHQFVTGASRTQSEEISVGGTDNVDAVVFDAFDYVALGHLHAPQNCGSERVRYSGTPLKYSFSEAGDKKSVTLITLKKKGELEVQTLPLIPKRDMCEIKGSYLQLTQKSFYENTTYTSDYMHVTLTDEEDVPDALAKLRVIYKNLMKLDYDNARTRFNGQITAEAYVERKSPLELFADLYTMQNNQDMTATQREFMQTLIERIWEEEK